MKVSSFWVSSAEMYMQSYNILDIHVSGAEIYMHKYKTLDIRDLDAQVQDT